MVLLNSALYRTCSASFDTHATDFPYRVSALLRSPTSPDNRRVLSSFGSSSHITLIFDTTLQKGPTVNRFGAPRSYFRLLTNTFTIPVSARKAEPWSAFGLPTADAVMLNDLVYSSWKTWDLPSLKIYAWPGIKTDEREIIHLSLSHQYHPGEGFADIMRTFRKDGSSTWEILLSPTTKATAPSRSFPVKQTLALFLWPAMFTKYLGEGGMAGVVLLWVCFMTAGYACITVMVAQWVVRSGCGREGGEVRRGQGAALRWEEEGWAIMNAASGEPAVRRAEDVVDDLLKDQV